MKQQEIDSIKHLIMSQDINDVELGLIIARILNVDIHEIHIIAQDLFMNRPIEWNNWIRDTYLQYLELDTPESKPIGWKKEAIIDT